MAQLRKLRHSFAARQGFSIVLLTMVLSAATMISAWPSVNLHLFLKNKELQFEADLILIILGGGLFGSSLRSLVTSWNQPHKRQQEAPVLSWKFFWGLPAALIVYIMVRGLVLSSTVDLSTVNFIGVNVIGILAGFCSIEITNRLVVLLQRLGGENPELEKKVERISMLLGADLLNNYDGYFVYRLEQITQEGSITIQMAFEEMTYELNAGDRYIISAWFSPKDFSWEQINPYSNWQSSPIVIEDGNDNEIIAFSVVSHLDAQKLNARKKDIVFNPLESSEPIFIEFLAPFNKSMPDLWIEVLQKNRLVAVITIPVKIKQL